MDKYIKHKVLIIIKEITIETTEMISKEEVMEEDMGEEIIQIEEVIEAIIIIEVMIEFKEEMIIREKIEMIISDGERIITD